MNKKLIKRIVFSILIIATTAHPSKKGSLSKYEESGSNKKRGLLSRLFGKPQINRKATEALFSGVRREDLIKVKKALAAGADVNAFEDDVDGDRGHAARTPLQVAVAFDVNSNIVKTLIEAGADVNAVGRRGSNPLIMLLVEKSRSNKIENIKQLLQAGARVNDRDNAGYNSLMVALIFDQVGLEGAIIEMLLNAGARVHFDLNFIEWVLSRSNELPTKGLRLCLDTLGSGLNTDSLASLNESLRRNIAALKHCSPDDISDLVTERSFPIIKEVIDQYDEADTKPAKLL
jgi:hypothetical protein